MKLLLESLRRHKWGENTGIFSVCSSHPLVIEAALRHALPLAMPALIEATSNQVNQYGGYTGMQPVDFRNLVENIAERVGFPKARIVLGGDHLGPNCWQNLTSDLALQKSDVMIDAYVRAGFRKIHLDCSMSCADDPVPLSDAIVAERAVRLCGIAELAWQQSGGDAPVYVIGTEVPVPGGAHESLGELEVTRPEAARATLQAHREAFAKAGLISVWPRIIGLVVQPGVEFDHHKVIDYVPQAAAELSKFIESEPVMLYEAHSTDYQRAQNLQCLVRDHFAILKVGPGLTFALREVLWSLDAIEQQLFSDTDSAKLRQTVLSVMHREPGYWNKYYTTHGSQLALDLQYSLSDRIRYYWPHPEVQAAMEKLFSNLNEYGIPLTLLSQHMPMQYRAVRDGHIENKAEALVMHYIGLVLADYSAACLPECGVNV